MNVIVTIPGFLGVPGDYDFLSSVIEPSNDFEWLSLDLFSGKSEWGPDLLMDDWAEKLNETVLPYSGQRILMGYSMGGRLASRALMRAPELWDHSLLISCNPLELADSEKESRGHWDKKWSQKFLTEDWDVLMKEWNSLDVFNSSNSDPNRDEDDYHREALSLALINWSPNRQYQPDGYQWAQKSRDLNWLVGLADKKYVAIQERIMDFAPNTRFHQTEGGHRLLSEGQLWISNWLEGRLK